jgi:signal peptidase II
MGKRIVKRRFWPYGLLIFIVVLFLDQYTKYFFLQHYALGESHKVFPGLWFTYVQNTGAVWGSLQDTNAMFIWLSVTAFGILIYFFDKFETVTEKISYSLILAGLWGNLLDRGVHGFVIDFIDLGWWPVFNIADSAISVGIVLYLLSQWRKPREVGITKKVSRKSRR